MPLLQMMMILLLGALPRAVLASVAFDLAFVDVRTGRAVPGAVPGTNTVVHTDDAAALTVTAVPRVVVDDDDKTFVSFELSDGETSYTFVDATAPHALFDYACAAEEHSDDVVSGPLKFATPYKLVATARDAGKILHRETISFRVDYAPPAPRVDRFVTSDDGRDVDAVVPGGCVFYPSGTTLAIRVEPSPGTKSVRFETRGSCGALSSGGGEGASSSSSNETDVVATVVSPSEHDSTTTDDACCWSCALPATSSEHTFGALLLDGDDDAAPCELLATPYSEADAGGVAGETAAITLDALNCGRSFYDAYVVDGPRTVFDPKRRAFSKGVFDGTTRLKNSDSLSSSSLPVLLENSTHIRNLTFLVDAHPAVKAVKFVLKRDDETLATRNRNYPFPFQFYGASGYTRKDGELELSGDLELKGSDGADLRDGDELTLTIHGFSKTRREGLVLFETVYAFTVDAAPNVVSRVFVGEGVSVGGSGADARETYDALSGDLLKPGFHRNVWEHGDRVERDTLWYHGDEDKVYNLCVETGAGVAYVELSGSFYALHKWNGDHASVDSRTSHKIASKRIAVSPQSPIACFLDADDVKSHPVQSVTGANIMVPGEFNLTATPYDATDAPGPTIDVPNVLVVANAQRTPIYDGALTVELELWKDMVEYNEVVYDAAPRRMWQISCVRAFGGVTYVAMQFKGLLFKYDPDVEAAAAAASSSSDDNATTTTTTISGIDLFLDVFKGMKRQGRALGRGSYWHGGLRSFDFHPLGNATHGRVYVTAMESRPSDPDAFRAQGLYLNWDAFEYYGDSPVPQDEESVIVEFTYADGVGDLDSYRLLFRVECPIYDHTIRQISFGVDDPSTDEDESYYLYILHGDGSVESEHVGNGQYNDGLGKVLRIDPLDGLRDLDAASALTHGDYSTAYNPWSPDDAPGFKLHDLPLTPDENRSSVPKEAFALGFRNPHSIAFTKSGACIVGEAMRDNFEEINVIRKGGNYGWPFYEGTYEHVIKPGTEVGGLFHSALPSSTDNGCPTCEFRFPVVAWGHYGFDSMQFNQIAMVGANSILENDSPAARHVDESSSGRKYENGGKYFYADFPFMGDLFYSYVDDFLGVRNTGDPASDDVEIAPMYKAKVRFEGVVYDSLRGAMASDPDDVGVRVNCRFGSGDGGSMLVFSKETGKIYKMTNSVAA